MTDAKYHFQVLIVGEEPTMHSLRGFERNRDFSPTDLERPCFRIADNTDSGLIYAGEAAKAKPLGW